MNRLADESSLYLRQHADNPVEWYPWGEEAFQRARAEDKPLFVSIGYAACHWCHVMAHESFEDPAIGAELARSFISVKVDREERPDVDAIYMAAVQAMNGSGGWPMSVFCTPDGRPFFAGTYYPKSDRSGFPSFKRVLAALTDAWQNQRNQVESQADTLSEAVRQQVSLADELATFTGEDPLPDFSELLEKLIGQLSGRFDSEWGGFGTAPKFPRPTFIELCLRHHARTQSSRSLEMATTTLDAMAAGGIYDHLAGGFARYSTDETWLVPHFEKMLTDQALLARAYLHAWQLTGNDSYLQVASETLDYVLNDLAGTEGGLWSSEDADSGGKEGAHATFTRAQVTEVMESAGRPDLTEPVIDWYGVTEHGNWEGTNVLRRPVGAPLKRPGPVELGRQILLAARHERPRPAVDDKALTEWNAMTVSVLAEAAAITGRMDWARSAESITDLLFDQLRRPDGRWLRSLQRGRARHLAFAADYAWVIDCCTRLGELTGKARWTDRASETAHGMLDLFGDPERPEGSASLFTTGKDAEDLLVRPRDLLDGAVPSANATAAGALARLAALTGEERFRVAAEGIVRDTRLLLEQSPLALADLLSAVDLLHGTVEVVVAGDRQDLLDAVTGRWMPGAVLAWGERTNSPLWQDRPDGAAYVCRRYSCGAPARDRATLLTQLPDPGR